MNSSRQSRTLELSEERLRSRWSAISQTVVVATLLLPFYTARADVSDESDVKEEIIFRCHYEMGEFGVEAVRLCIEAENSAVKALSAYPERAKAIIFRCTGYAHGYGWAKVKLCADQDIEAEAALAQYPAEHAALIETCRREVEKQGPAKVKACADQRIAAKRK
jgi:hypothetical protein